MRNLLFVVFFWTALGLGALAQKAMVKENQQPGAPQSVLQAALQLLGKSAQLASAGQRFEAVEAARAAVSALERSLPGGQTAYALQGFEFPPEGQTAYLWLFTQALDMWTVRLIEAGRLDEAARAAHETVQVARQAAAPDADVNSIASLLLTLSSRSVNAGLRPAAVEAAQAAADVLQEEEARRNAAGGSVRENP
jgi:hypothetical protein